MASNLSKTMKVLLNTEAGKDQTMHAPEFVQTTALCTKATKTPAANLHAGALHLLGQRVALQLLNFNGLAALKGKILGVYFSLQGHKGRGMCVSGCKR